MDNKNKMLLIACCALMISISFMLIVWMSLSSRSRALKQLEANVTVGQEEIADANATEEPATAPASEEHAAVTEMPTVSEEDYEAEREAERAYLKEANEYTGYMGPATEETDVMDAGSIPEDARRGWDDGVTDNQYLNYIRNVTGDYVDEYWTADGDISHEWLYWYNSEGKLRKALLYY